MCQLLGMSANVPTDLVFSFTGLSARAVEHRDGFGIAFFDGAAARLFVDPASAGESAVARLIRETPIHSTHVVAHIRKATQGAVSLANTHPFVRELWGRHWVFAHNGNLVDAKLPLHAGFRAVGQTDSEHAFCWLLQELAKAHAAVPTPTALRDTLAELLPQVARFGTFNMLLSNGDALWAHASTDLHWLTRQAPFGAARLADDDMTIDFARHTRPDDRVTVVATQPLTHDEPWQRMAPGEVVAFVDGRRLP